MDGILIGIAALVLLVIAGVWGALALDRYRRTCPRPTWNGVLVWSFMRAYARLVHRSQTVGIEHMRAAMAGGRPIILVANHAGAADPIVIQAACTFEVRWMMMRTMNQGIAVCATWYGRIILVEQDARDFAGTRQALRHLAQGQAIGIFPEGGIARPPGVLREFQTGVGFLVRKSKATVLPVWLEGMPEVDVAMSSLWRRGRARVHFGQPMQFDESADDQTITKSIRNAIARMSHWPHAEVDATEALR